MEFEIGNIILEEEIDIGNFELDIQLDTVVLENLEVTPTREEQVFNHPNSGGYDEVKVKAIISENLNILPTLEEQEFNGLYDNVKVNPVTNTIDKNIISENIRAGVNILGVEGTLEDGYKVNVTDNTLVFSNGGTVEGSELIV